MEWAPFTTHCDCSCHHASGIANPASVDVRDPVEAVTACLTCRDKHCPAILLEGWDVDAPKTSRDREPWQDAANFCPPDKGEGPE